jgi:hypothetical protein
VQTPEPARFNQISFVFTGAQSRPPLCTYPMGNDSPQAIKELSSSRKKIVGDFIGDPKTKHPSG